MEGYNDVFISYGRGESKAFAAKLNKHLSALGKSVWLDLEDIPLGIDFQEQIDTGIEKADNFLYIIAPHAIKSEFCLKEILLALKYNKRIIPILHIEPSEKAVWDKLHPAIGKLNWVYMRQKLDPTKPQSDWEFLDDFDHSFTGLAELLSLQKEFIYQHTVILNQGLDWERHQKQSNRLLYDLELKAAQKWMLTEFVPPQQPPCFPSLLHGQYISESKKWSDFSMPEVFISYAREDVAWREKIRNELSFRVITSWTDTGDIKSGMSFEEAINQGIEYSDSFVFLISPSSIVSVYCLKELDYVLSLHKRVIPLMIEKIPDHQIPEKIRGIQYIDFTIVEDETQLARKSKNIYERNIDLLLNALKTDADYYKEHKEVLVQQMDWERTNKQNSLLFRGFHLQEVEAWLKAGRSRSVDKPLAQQEAFIEECIAKAPEIVTEVFICFDESDGQLARRINRELNLYGKTTWFDHDYIDSESDRTTELRKGIEASDNFLFVASEASLVSAEVKGLIDFAVENNKRIIPIVKSSGIDDQVKVIADTDLRVDFQVSNRDFFSSFSELLRIIDTDREHVINHTKWLKRSIEWQNASKSKDLLVVGTEFEIYAMWYEATFNENKKPGIAKVQEAFFLAGKQAKRKKILIRNIIALSLLLLTVLSVIAGGVALVQKGIAQKNAEEAKRNADIAKQNEAKAIKNKLLADENAERATLNEKKAEASALEAKKNAEIAIANEQQALRNKAEAENNMTLAQKNEKIANDNRAKALLSKKKAELEGFSAKFSNDEASFEKLLTKANELAIQSNNISERKRGDVKTLLALSSYRLYRAAYDNLKKNLKTKYDTLLQFEDKTMPQYSQVLELHNRLEDLTKVMIEPNRTYRALREAYLFDKSHKDTIISAESWSSLVLKDGSIVVNDRFGHLKLITVKSREERLPTKLTEVPLGGNEVVFATTFAETDQSVFCGTHNGQIVSWMKGNWSSMNVICRVGGKILSMVESHTQKVIFYSIGGDIFKLDLASNKSTLFDKGKSTIRTMSFMDGAKEILLTGNDKGEITAYTDPHQSNSHSVINNKLLNTAIYSMAYNLKRGLLAVGNSDGHILLIENVTPSNILESKEMNSYLSDSKHNGIVKSVCFSKNGDFLATGSLDRKLFFWNITNKSMKDVAQSSAYFVITLDNKILSLSISDDNQYLLFNDERMLHVTATNSLNYYDILCRHKSRNFTDSELRQYLHGIKPKDYELCQ